MRMISVNLADFRLLLDAAAQLGGSGPPTWPDRHRLDVVLESYGDMLKRMEPYDGLPGK